MHQLNSPGVDARPKGRARRFSRLAAAIAFASLAVTTAAAPAMATHANGVGASTTSGSCYRTGGAYGHGKLVTSSKMWETGKSRVNYFRTRVEKQRHYTDGSWRTVWTGAWDRYYNDGHWSDTHSDHVYSRNWTVNLTTSDVAHYTRLRVRFDFMDERFGTDATLRTLYGFSRTCVAA